VPSEIETMESGTKRIAMERLAAEAVSSQVKGMASEVEGVESDDE